MRFTFALGDTPLEGYTIKRGIGLGGFGEVYYAVSDAGKEVALKRIQRNVDIEVRGVQQCINLKSPNLVAIYDIRKDDHGDVWVVMEYVQGANLKDVVEAHGNGLAPDQVVHWFRGILAGVSHLHDHGIVHRDLKPGNIFEELGVVKVGDYGLCKIITCSRRDGHTESVGTVHYMAPEIGKGEYGKEIDVYALGIILYELVTGTVPFDGETTQEILFKHLTAEPDLRVLDPPIAAIVARALHKDPQRRFRDAAEMRTAFEEAINGTGSDQWGRPVEASLATAEAVADHRGKTATMQLPPREASRPIPPRVAPARVPPSAASPWPAPDADEPIAAALGRAYTRFMRWWHRPSMGRAARAAIIAGAIVVALLSAEIALPAILVLSTLYVTYLVARALIRSPEQLQQLPSSAAPAAGTAAAAAGRHRRTTHSRHLARRLRDRGEQIAATRRFLARRGLRHELRDLIGGAILSSGVVALLTMAMMALVGQLSDIPASEINVRSWWTPFLWVSATSTLSTWSLLVLGAVWRRNGEDVTFHRFPQFFFGLLVGLAAYGMARHLLVSFQAALMWPTETVPSLKIPETMYGFDGQPTLLAFLVYFGSLWAVLGWWKNVDPCRGRAWSLGRVVVAGLTAWILAAVWEFPQPWGILVAVNTAVATQLVSPWVSRKKRRIILARELHVAPPTETA